MNLSSGVSVGQLAFAIFAMIATGGIAWGGLLQRVKTLEREVEALSGFAERLTRIEEQSGFIRAELGKLTGSWLFRAPPEYAGSDYSPGGPSKRKTPHDG